MIKILIIFGILVQALLGIIFGSCEGDGHDHHYQASVTQATCTEQGFTTYTCDCGDSYVADYVSALGHDLMNFVNAEPTCTQNGQETISCKRCDMLPELKEIPAIGHSLINHAAKYATCTEIGWYAYKTCANCDYTTYEEVPALGHSIKQHDGKTATCTEKGWEAYVDCSNCDYTTYSEISALGHSLVNHDGKTATCTEKGWEAYVDCSNCDYTTYSEISALGHSLVNHDGKMATCTEKGWEAYVDCSNCDYTTYSEIPMTEHKYTQYNGMAPTCLGFGWNDYTVCDTCGYSTYTYLPALGHDLKYYGAENATCTEKGWYAYETCTRCTYSTYFEIPPLGHDLVSYDAQDPTTESVGWYDYVACNRCDYTTYTEIAKLPGENTDDPNPPTSEYTLRELPIIVINTLDGADITSKEIYSMSTVSVLNTDEKNCLEEVSAGVRGRGNSTWTMDKKGYRIKFDKKTAMLGADYKAKSWTLIANYSDMTLSRNAIAYELAQQMEAIKFSSVHHYVELYLNGEYLGVYLLCDQMQTGTGRVEIDETLNLDGDIGFFVELDGRATEEGDEDVAYFKFDGNFYTIKTPDTDSETYQANSAAYVSKIKDYFSLTWNAMNTSWEETCKYIDVYSFAETYLINELFENIDSAYFSWYLHRDIGGKLISGPVWDFDIAGGNYYSYADFLSGKYAPDTTMRVAEQHVWYAKLLQYPQFQQLVAKKILVYENMIAKVLNTLNVNSESYIYAKYKTAFDSNFERWQILGTYVWQTPMEVVECDTVDKQMTYLYNWLTARYKYLKGIYYYDGKSWENVPLVEVPDVPETPDGPVVEEGFKATFTVTDGVQIVVYDTKDYTAEGTVALEAIAKDSDTGAILTDGEGQINFKVVVPEGVTIDSVTVNGTYKNLKEIDVENHIYRITKVKGDLQITVTVA